MAHLLFVAAQPMPRGLLQCFEDVGAGRVLPLSTAGLGLSLSRQRAHASLLRAQSARANGGPGIGASGIRRGASRSHGVLGLGEEPFG